MLNLIATAPTLNHPDMYGVKKYYFTAIGISGWQQSFLIIEQSKSAVAVIGRMAKRLIENIYEQPINVLKLSGD